MAIRASADNLSLVLPSQTSAPAVRDFTEVWAHREALRQACVRMIGDAARAEDLVQDTFVSALKCSSRLHQDQPVAPWLKTVARRRSIDELRGRDRVSLMATLPEAATATGDDPAEHVVSQELVGALRTAIAQLTPRERQLLLRQASYGLSLAELAAEEHTSIASVRSVLARARHKLRGSLERGGVFGVLPLPRYLASLRERIGRWGMQLEPTLPAVTGAGARMGEVVAAVVTAITMLLTGVANPPSYREASLATTGLASSSFALNDADGAGAMPRGRSLDGSGGDGGGTGFGARTTPTSVPSGSPIGPLPPHLGDNDLPYDKTYTPEDLVIEHFAASGDGETVLAAGRSDRSLTRPILFRSDDAGVSWTRVTEPSVDDLEEASTFPGGELFLPQDFPDDPRVFALSDGNLYRSNDAGLTFSLVAPAMGKIVSSPAFGVGDDRFFAAGPPPGEYEDTPTPTVERTALVPPWTTSWSDIDIVLGPAYVSTGEVLISGSARSGMTKSGLVYTCAAGACSKRGTLPIETPAQLQAMAESPDTVFAWVDWWMARSTDGGATFVADPLPLGFGLLGMADGGDKVYRFGVTMGEAAPLHRSDDGGATWVSLALDTPLGNGISAMITLPSGRLLASQFKRGVYCSDDHGVTWTPRCSPA